MKQKKIVIASVAIGCCICACAYILKIGMKPLPRYRASCRFVYAPCDVLTNSVGTVSRTPDYSGDRSHIVSRLNEYATLLGFKRAVGETCVKSCLQYGVAQDKVARAIDTVELSMVDDSIPLFEVAAISDGEMLNYSNIASDCGVSAKTVKSYFQILYDTLIGYEIPAFRKEIKRKIIQAPRFYYFDVGLANYLMGRTSLKRGTDDYGHAFEHFVMQEIIAYKGYNDKRDTISYWHTYDQKEVDAVIGDAKVAIEIKSSEHVETKHKKGLKAFKEEHPDCRMILVSLDPITRKSGDEELIYVLDFLKMLWNGDIF